MRPLNLSGSTLIMDRASEGAVTLTEPLLKSILFPICSVILRKLFQRERYTNHRLTNKKQVLSFRGNAVSFCIHLHLRVGHLSDVGFGEQDISKNADNPANIGLFDGAFINHFMEFVHHCIQFKGGELGSVSQLNGYKILNCVQNISYIIWKAVELLKLFVVFCSNKE